MTALLRRVLVPLSNETDAVRTTANLITHVDEDRHDQPAELILLHVIEKGGGTIDKAPLPATKEHAQTILDTGRLTLESEGYEVRTEIRYGTNVVRTVHEAAEDVDATVILFRPREHGPLTRLVLKDRTGALVKDAPCPVITLPTA